MVYLKMETVWSNLNIHTCNRMFMHIDKPTISICYLIKLSISELEDGKIMYDTYIGADVLVKCPIFCILADNPRASEFEHHLGSSAKKFCRKRNVS